MTEQTHGGRRVGAGRKPKSGIKKQDISLYLQPDTVEFLRTQASASETVDKIVQRSKDYRQWQKQPKTPEP